MAKKKKERQSRRLAKPVLSWTEVKLITSRRHRIEGALSFRVSTISRQQVLPEYERIWEQTIAEEAYQQAMGELLDQGDVVLRVEDSMGFSFIMGIFFWEHLSTNSRNEQWDFTSMTLPSG
ncbi:hypothetical protein VCRA2113O326_80201 [Vibrio crassostreae]|nr:hypothetical protein VCRA2113O326_80201 [Vibrio crassostreae]CAK3050617.1 hypothetical protein VCRA2113O321_90202 [Vibrio crassostreae]